MNIRKNIHKAINIVSLLYVFVFKGGLQTFYNSLIAFANSEKRTQEHLATFKHKFDILWKKVLYLDSLVGSISVPEVSKFKEVIEIFNARIFGIEKQQASTKQELDSINKSLQDLMNLVGIMGDGLKQEIIDINNSVDNLENSTVADLLVYCHNMRKKLDKLENSLLPPKPIMNSVANTLTPESFL